MEAKKIKWREVYFDNDSDVVAMRLFHIQFLFM
jgi:hypothetical protein